MPRSTCASNKLLEQPFIKARYFPLWKSTLQLTGRNILGQADANFLGGQQLRHVEKYEGA